MVYNIFGGIMNEFKYCKVEVFIPKEYLNALCEVFNRLDVGHIGRYSECLSYSEVIGRWKPLDGTNPFIGEIGKLEEEKELKVEVTCKVEIINKLIEEIKKVHPYEEPVINVIPLYKVGL
jgi:hypothetical protein